MLDELKFRYRALKLWVRLLIVSLLGLLPAAYDYLDSAPVLEAEQEAAITKETAARQKLATAKSQIKDLPAMEEKLSFTKDQLIKAKERLPSEIWVDEVLQMVSKSANEADVSIKQFVPQGTKLVAGEFPYNEVRFRIQMEGKFGRLGAWMDSVGGAGSRAYVKSWNMTRGTSLQRPLAVNTRMPGMETQQVKPPTAKEIAQNTRDDMQVALTSDLVYYTSPTDAQLAAAAAAEDAAKDEKNKQANPAAPAKKAGGA